MTSAIPEQRTSRWGSVGRLLLLGMLTYAAIAASIYALIESRLHETSLTDWLRTVLYHAPLGIKASQVARAETAVVAWLPVVLAATGVLLAGRHSDDRSRWARRLGLANLVVYLGCRAVSPDWSWLPAVLFLASGFLAGLVLIVRRRRDVPLRRRFVVGMAYVVPVIGLLWAVQIPMYHGGCGGNQRSQNEDIARAIRRVIEDTDRPSTCWRDASNLVAESFPTACGRPLARCSDATSGAPCWNGPYLSRSSEWYRADVAGRPLRIEIHEQAREVLVASAGADGVFQTPEMFNDDDIVVVEKWPR